MGHAPGAARESQCDNSELVDMAVRDGQSDRLAARSESAIRNSVIRTPLSLPVIPVKYLASDRADNREGSADRHCHHRLLPEQAGALVTSHANR
jgi:hypothetical protein